MQDKSEAIAEAQNPAEEITSEEQAIAALLGGEVPDQPEEPETDTEEEAEESEAGEDAAEEAEESEEEEEEAEPSGTVEGIDLDKLTDEEWEIVRTKLKSRAAADIQSLKRENKAKDEAIAALKAQTQQAATPNPAESRFLTGINTPEELEAEVTRLKQMARDTENILDEHEDYGPEDPIEIGGKNFTKKGLKALRNEIREALDEAVPYKRHQFEKAAELRQEEEVLNAQARVEVKELEDEESPVAKNFKVLNESDLFKEIRQKVPNAAPGIEILLAHFCRSKYGGKAKAATPVTTGKPPKANPPSSPSGVAAAPSKPASKEKELDRLRAGAESGSRADLEKYLASKL